MRAHHLWLAAALALAVTLPASARQSRAERGEVDLAQELKGLVPGKPQSCINLSEVNGSHIIEGTAIVYRATGGTLYVNRPGGAMMLHDDDIPVQYIYGSQLCRLDRMNLLDRSTRMERGFANLGDFVPYTKPRRD